MDARYEVHGLSVAAPPRARAHVHLLTSPNTSPNRPLPAPARGRRGRASGGAAAWPRPAAVGRSDAWAVQFVSMLRLEGVRGCCLIINFLLHYSHFWNRELAAVSGVAGTGAWLQPSGLSWDPDGEAAQLCNDHGWHQCLRLHSVCDASRVNAAGRRCAIMHVCFTYVQMTKPCNCEHRLCAAGEMRLDIVAVGVSCGEAGLAWRSR